MVELALVAPLMVSLVFGVSEFGYVFYTYTRLEKAVHDAARYASLRTYLNSDSTGSYAKQVKNAVVFGRPDGSGTAIASNLSTSNVVVVVSPSSGARPQTVRVYISSYKMPMSIGGWSFTLRNKPDATFPYLGRWVDN